MYMTSRQRNPLERYVIAVILASRFGKSSSDMNKPLGSKSPT